MSGIRGSSRTSTTTHQPSSMRFTADTPSVGWLMSPSRLRQAARAAWPAPRMGGERRAAVVEDFPARGRRSSAMNTSLTNVGLSALRAEQTSARVGSGCSGLKARHLLIRAFGVRSASHWPRQRPRGLLT